MEKRNFFLWVVTLKYLFMMLEGGGMKHGNSLHMA